MKRTLVALFTVLLFAGIAAAAPALPAGFFAGASAPPTGPAHQAILNWTAPADVGATTAYNVYRVNAPCPASGIGTLIWTKLTAAPITPLTYTDATITIGAWCYYVTQVQLSFESGPSPTFGGSASPFPVTSLSGSVQ